MPLPSLTCVRGCNNCRCAICDRRELLLSRSDRDVTQRRRCGPNFLSSHACAARTRKHGHGRNCHKHFHQPSSSRASLFLLPQSSPPDRWDRPRQPLSTGIVPRVLGRHVAAVHLPNLHRHFNHRSHRRQALPCAHRSPGRRVLVRHSMLLHVLRAACDRFCRAPKSVPTSHFCHFPSGQNLPHFIG